MERPHTLLDGALDHAGTLMIASTPALTLDAVLVGHVILEDPGAADVTEAWLAAPIWREALTILRRAQHQGQRLGDLIIAGRVLARAHCDFLLCDVPPPGHEDQFPVPDGPHDGGSNISLPYTVAAEAVCAAFEVPLAVVLPQARERCVQLELARLGRLLALYGDTMPAVLFAALPTLRARCTEIELLADHYGVVPVDVRPPVARPAEFADDDLPDADDLAPRAAVRREDPPHRIVVW